MDTIYLKIDIHSSDDDADEIREAGYFFQYIADAVCIDREQITEIHERNFRELVPAMVKHLEQFEK